MLRISPRIINSLRSYIKHSKECFLLFPKTSKLVKFCELMLRMSPRIINSLRSYIKHSKECFLLFPKTSKLVKKTRLRLVFPTYFSVFGNRRKHSSSCLIYYINIDDCFVYLLISHVTKAKYNVIVFFFSNIQPSLAHSSVLSFAE